MNQDIYTSQAVKSQLKMTQCLLKISLHILFLHHMQTYLGVIVSVESIFDVVRRVLRYALDISLPDRTYFVSSDRGQASAADDYD